MPTNKTTKTTIPQENTKKFGLTTRFLRSFCETMAARPQIHEEIPPTVYDAPFVGPWRNYHKPFTYEFDFTNRFLRSIIPGIRESLQNKTTKEIKNHEEKITRTSCGLCLPAAIAESPIAQGVAPEHWCPMLWFCPLYLCFFRWSRIYGFYRFYLAHFPGIYLPTSIFLVRHSPVQALCFFLVWHLPIISLSFCFSWHIRVYIFSIFLVRHSPVIYLYLFLLRYLPVVWWYLSLAWHIPVIRYPCLLFCFCIFGRCTSGKRWIFTAYTCPKLWKFWTRIWRRWPSGG